VKKLLLGLIVAALGVGTGAAAAYGMVTLLGGPAEAKVENLETTFVPAGKILAPLVFPDGRLSGYVSFELSIEVPAERSEEIAARLPLLLNAINMRTYRTPMASGPDGMLPNISLFRDVAMAASAEAFGKGIVRRAAITQAVPA